MSEPDKLGPADIPDHAHPEITNTMRALFDRVFERFDRVDTEVASRFDEVSSRLDRIEDILKRERS